MSRAHPSVALLSGRPFASQALAVLAIWILLVLAPFSGALAVHHELAAADHDGHQHSDFDLCQWVQHTGNGSLQVVAPQIEFFLLLGLHQLPEPQALGSVRLAGPGQPRAPPVF